MPTETKDVPASESRSISSFYVPWSLENGDSPQLEFHTCNAKYRLMVGSYGSGKSKPLLMEAIFHALEYPGSDSIILRKTIPDLKRTVIDKFLSDIPRWVYEFYHQGDHIVYFHPQEEVIDGKKTGRLLQSKLRFGACEREADVGKYLSTEYVFVGFEELGEFSFAIFDALAGRNRAPSIPNARPCLAAATNPMGVGWSFIKKLWVEHRAIYGMDADKYDPADYEFFHSTVDQNPLLRTDKEYIKRLEASPLRDKIRWGKLDSVTGQYFENWQPGYKDSEGKWQHRHVRPRSHFVFEDWQPTWVGWDYGFGHYATILFFTKAKLVRWAGDRPRLVNVAIKELVLHENTPKQQAEALILSIPRAQFKFREAGREWTEEEEEEYRHRDLAGYAWRIDSIHFSWERFNRTTSTHTVADEVGAILQSAGLPFPTRSNTDRIAGWQKCYDLLDTDEFFILEGECPSLQEAIPMLVRGDGVTHPLEDVVKPKGLSLNDDIGDAWRYGIAGTLLDAEEVPEHIKRRERLAAIEDPMRRAVAAYKEYNQKRAAEKKPQKPPSVPTWRHRLGQQ